MSEDAPTHIASTSNDELDAKHRKELRDLQARITQKKKQATKKTRKGVNDECDRLEQEIKVRQQQERNELNGQSQNIDGHAELDKPDVDDVELAKTTGDLKLTEDAGAGKDTKAESEHADETTDPRQGKKPNRQKARLARRAAEQEAAADEAAREASSMTDYKAREQEVISAAIEKRGLVEHRVRSDGHCLYAAMADQLDQAGVPLEKDAYQQGVEDYRVVRKEVANWVLRHPDDYLPFLDEEDMAKGIEGYASKIGETGEWGGQLEIAACARRWGLIVNVLQGDGRVEKIDGGDAQGKECWLAYYKHSFGLGEHYNSLRKKAKA